MTSSPKCTLLGARQYRQAGAIIEQVTIVEDGEEKCEGCRQRAQICTTCGVWLCPECYDSIGEGEEEDEEEA